MSETVVTESVETLAEVLKAHRYEAGSGGRICSCGAIGRPDPGSITTLQAVHMDHLAAELIASGAVHGAAEVRAEGEARIQRALLAARVVCPVHGIPDCGPLLNGCSVPRYIAEWRGEFLVDLRAALAEGGGDRD